MEINAEIIKIGQILSPSKFYFVSTENFEKLKIIQQNELQRLIESPHRVKNYIPQDGEICAFYHQQSMKWLKVQVEGAGESIKLWSVDYGFLIKTDGNSKFAPISKEFQIDSGLVETGCLNILPGSQKFDFETFKTIMCWAPEAVVNMKNFVKFAHKLRFITVGTSNGIKFGDIEATDIDGKQFSLCTALLRNNLALASEQQDVYEVLMDTNLLSADRFSGESDNDFSLKFEEIDKIRTQLNPITSIINNKAQKKSENTGTIAKIPANVLTVSRKSGNVKEGIVKPMQFTSSVGFKSENKKTAFERANISSTVVSRLDTSSVSPMTLSPASNKGKTISQLSRKALHEQRLEFRPLCNFAKLWEELLILNPSKSSPTAVANLSSSSDAISLSRKSNQILPAPVKLSKSNAQKKKIVTKHTTTKSTNSVLAEILGKESSIVSSLGHVFIHGKNLPDPLENVAAAMFQQQIHEYLRKQNFRSVFRTQSHSWPLILEGRSTFIVNSKSSGKTYSYLPAVLSSIMYEIDDEPPTAQGPTSIIIVRSSREVEMLYRLSISIVRNDKIKIIAAFGKWNCDNKKVSLLNGCDLLITTPPCFSRLAQGEVIRMFNKDRIRRIVFDDLYKMQDVFGNEIKDIVNTCTYGSDHPGKNPQLVVTTSTWKGYIRSYMNLTCEPVLIFGNFLEAAVFAKCQFNITMNTFDMKVQRLTAWMHKNEWMEKKTMIVCYDTAEVYYLRDCFIKNKFGFVILEKESQMVLRDEIECDLERWTQEAVSKMKVLLITDKTMNELKIRCAQILIHFSLPAKWTKFSARFGSSTDQFHKFLAEKCEPQQTMIMLDNNKNWTETPRLIEFVESHKLIKKIDPDIKKLVQEIIVKREVDKRDAMEEYVMPICPNIFQFGDCANFATCEYRHVFVEELDKCEITTPCDGLVKFNLVHILNPSHYVIKILEYLPAKQKSWISCDEKLKAINESLESIQINMRAGNPMIHTPVKINDMCLVLWSRNSIWCRCKVLEKEQTDKMRYKVRVKLIDFGREIIVMSSDLMIMPEKLKLLAPLVAELRIVNLVPFDSDENWDRETTLVLENFFKEKENIGKHVICKVNLAVQNTIFAESFDIRVRVKGTDQYRTKYALKMDLLKKDFCLKDETVEGKLKALLKHANMYVPEDVEESEIGEVEALPIVAQANPSWKLLSMGSDYGVNLKHFESPEKFFVVLDSSTNKTMRKLMEPVENCDQRIPLKEIKEEGLCLVALNGHKTRRGIIHKLNPDESVSVFLLDIGDVINCVKNEIFELPAAVINALPFQVVQCRLEGIKARFGMEWKKRSCDMFRDFLQNEKCFDKLLKLFVVAKNENIYDVKLFHPENGEQLNKLAVEKKIADADGIEEICIEDLMEDQEQASDDELTEVNTEKASNNKLTEVYTENAESEWTKLQKILNEEDEETLSANDLLRVMGYPSTARLVRAEDCPLNQESLDVKAQNSSISGIEALVDLPSETSNVSLHYIHKHPKIEWRQNEIIIFITVSVIDCIKYGLFVDDSVMKIYIKYESAYEYAVVQLFGAIDTQCVLHEKTGSNIIIRLFKNVNTLWSRLTYLNEPNRFITYSSEPLPENLIGVVSAYSNSRPGGDSDVDSQDGDVAEDKFIEILE